MNRKWFIKSAKCAQCSHRWGIFRWISNNRNCTATFSVHRHPFKPHGMVRWWRVSATASPPFDSTWRKTNYWLLQTIVDRVRVRSSNLICGEKKIYNRQFFNKPHTLAKIHFSGSSSTRHGKSEIEISSIYFSNEIFPAVRPKWMPRVWSVEPAPYICAWFLFDSIGKWSGCVHFMSTHVAWLAEKF